MSLDKRLNAYRPDLADARLKGQVDSARFVEGTQHQVAVGMAPLKEAPNWDSRLATELLYGERVTVFEERAGWAWVQAASDSYVGYVHADCLEEPGPEPTHRVTALHTFLYAEADLKSPPLDILPMTADVALLGPAKGRFLEAAPEGWLFDGHVAPANQPAADFVTIAEQFLHAPYLWGGKSDHGIDCSGLVQISLRAAGLQVPRDTDMQAASVGQQVDGDAPRRRGDLVYFPGHVGIMLDAEILLHANAWSMTVASEPLKDVVARIAKTESQPVTCVRRL